MRYILLFLFILNLYCTPSKPKIRLSAGAALAPINPPLGSFIAGADRNRKFSGVKDSLYAKAVVISDGNTSLAIVTIDCIGLLNPEIRKIQKLASEKSSVPAENIIISSTHTHAGPDVVGIWGPDPLTSGVDTTYVSFLIQTAVDQIILAEKNKQPVKLFGNEAEYKADWFSNICNEELDHSISTLQLKTESGISVATLTNFACHPTFLDTHFSVVSSDYPASFYRQMDFTQGGVNLFLQGAIGGWVQPKDDLFKGELLEIPFQFNLADYYGKNLADTVANLLLSASLIDEPEIVVRSLDFYLPVENQNWKLLSRAGVIRREVSDSVKTNLSWFSIGSAQFSTHPGETTPWLSLETKKLMKSGPRFVLGLSQDALGYILKPEFFSDTSRLHAGYLTSMSLGSKTTPILLEKIKVLSQP